MEYIDVTWRHNSPSDPVRLVSELGDDRYETRKLEFFRDGRVGYACEVGSAYDTVLGEVTVPLFELINRDPEFSGKRIDAEEFDRLWRTHVTEALP